MQPEPDGFDRDVRKKGQAALNAKTTPLPPYWRPFIPALEAAYRRICSYSCLWIPPGTGAPTVEHFAPKSKELRLAYEWSNYRLVCAKMNSRKNHFEDVLDPFRIGHDWFELEFLFLQVRAAAHLDSATMRAVDNTILRLGLNDDEFRGARQDWYECWRQQKVSTDFVESHLPFIYREAVRLDMVPRAGH